MTAGEAALLLFSTFGVLVFLRVPVSFALGIACLPVLLIDPRMSPFILMERTFKAYWSFILLAVPFFLLAANLMNMAGITDRLINLSKVAVGHLPGGLGHINVLVSMLFAGISGSSTADAAGIGKLLIPAMVKQGYDVRFSVAITACSSVMGVIIPPSILMVVWGGVMSVSIGALFLAGVIPGVCIAGAMMATVYAYAKVYKYPIYHRSTLRELLPAFGGAVFALLTPVIIVAGIVFGIFTPTESSVVAVIYTLIIGVVLYRTINARKFVHAVYDTGRFAAISLFCIGTASAFGNLLAYYKVPAALVEWIAAMSLGRIETGFMIAAAFLLIGLFIDAIPAIIILGTILFPVATSVGMHPVHFAIIGVISLAFGLVTPPYGLCLLIASAIGGISVVKALKDVAIVLLPMLGILTLVILLPDLILWLPRLVMPQFM
ncbi:MAG: TRAP transporter large permease [Rhodospirillaceae bacterium]|nr:TRAP transporter large permease [Rhodospirillaceae bacterium]